MKGTRWDILHSAFSTATLPAAGPSSEAVIFGHFGSVTTNMPCSLFCSCMNSPDTRYPPTPPTHPFKGDVLLQMSADKNKQSFHEVDRQDSLLIVEQ